MTKYKCFNCNKQIADTSFGKRVRCVYCGGKMLFKPRTMTTTVLAR